MINQEENLPELEPKKKNTLKQELIEWGKSLLFAAVVVGLLFGFVIRPVEVDGESMEPTLQNSDRLIVYMLFYKPQQGDVVTLSDKTGLDEALVKRVIATEGQTVDINERGQVLVDGVLLDEPYIAEYISPRARGEHEYPVTVPEGRIFVMGDNRNYSTDSRFSQVSFVDVKEVQGKVVLRLLPLQHFGLI